MCLSVRVTTARSQTSAELQGSIGRKPALIVLMSLFGEALISPSASPQRHERPSDFQRIGLSETHSGWADLTGPG
ncbi:hypothetical protein PBY51_017016 [Eleginops maclovinus]|uniref:Uncharacterized protein n=1 Tax=Eleginops maclovinus TaxID=56733 RepID=A0AAN7WRP0_ELEMC|nr:hypothetical protein PBY51_017016 [Eleginops maclovinus]